MKTALLWADTWLSLREVSDAHSDVGQRREEERRSLRCVMSDEWGRTVCIAGEGGKVRLGELGKVGFERAQTDGHLE